MKKSALKWISLGLGAGLALAAWSAENPPIRQPKPAKAAPGKKYSPKAAPAKKVYPTFGSVERLDPALDALIAPGTKIEKLAGGFQWAEGPVWEPKSGTLLFSDVPRNVIFQWKEGYGTRDFLYPSGYTSSIPRGGGLGANGLTLDAQGRLVICQHGNRQIVRLERNGKLTVLARYYKGRRFNSPNDLVYDARGNLYFTDPPYGLEKGDQDPAKELVFNGLFLLRPGGEVVALRKDLTYPNGVALSPHQKVLYVTVSDPAKPVVMAYPIRKDGLLDPGAVFFDAKPLAAKGWRGLPDGIKTDKDGNLFVAGPGGVLVISPLGKLLGVIRPGVRVSNCAWGDDGSTLYITGTSYLCRIKTRTVGREFVPKLAKERWE